MRKMITYSLLICCISGCKKEVISLEQPDARLENKLNTYQAQLTSAEYGWFGYLFTPSGATSTFLFQFDKQGRVITLANINENTAQAKSTGSYRLKATQLPSLYFDSYSYLHLLADPDPDVLDGTVGAGFESDLEFSILSASSNQIYLKGNLNGSKMILVRAQKDERVVFEADPLLLKSRWEDPKTFKYYYNRLTLGTKQYDIVINTRANTINFFSNNGGFKQFSTSCVHTPTGILLAEPFIDGDLRVEEFRDVKINKSQGSVSLLSGAIRGNIQNVATPLVTDPNAPDQMYHAKSYYVSATGFTSNGTSDIFQVTTIPSFYGVIYWPSYGHSPYSSLRVHYLLGSVSYGQLFSTQIRGDKIVFSDPKSYIGESQGPVFEQSTKGLTNQFLTPGGYYVFQTGAGSYDLVSVIDAKTWIRFQ